eukprot:SAG31_NODE_1008_length_10407_cov_2.369131_5_plen_162_part_00
MVSFSWRHNLMTQCKFEQFLIQSFAQSIKGKGPQGIVLQLMCGALALGSHSQNVIVAGGIHKTSGLPTTQLGCCSCHQTTLHSRRCQACAQMLRDLDRNPVHRLHLVLPSLCTLLECFGSAGQIHGATMAASPLHQPRRATHLGVSMDTIKSVVPWTISTR